MDFLKYEVVTKVKTNYPNNMIFPSVQSLMINALMISMNFRISTSNAQHLTEAKPKPMEMKSLF